MFSNFHFLVKKLMDKIYHKKVVEARTSCLKSVINPSTQSRTYPAPIFPFIMFSAFARPK